MVVDGESRDGPTRNLPADEKNERCFQENRKRLTQARNNKEDTDGAKGKAEKIHD
jgi:hypothetical protein